jgi:hypothetical protein
MAAAMTLNASMDDFMVVFLRRAQVAAGSSIGEG